MDICKKLRWMADKHCNELIEAAEEIERLREGLKIASAAVANNDVLIAEQNKLAAERKEWGLKLQSSVNEHRNAAMEADLRTQAAVRSENLVRDMMQTIISIAHDGSLEKGDRLQRIAVRAAKYYAQTQRRRTFDMRGRRRLYGDGPSRWIGWPAPCRQHRLLTRRRRCKTMK